MKKNVVYNAGFLSIEGEALIRVSTIQGVDVFDKQVVFYLKKKSVVINCESSEEAKELLSTITGKILGELE